MQGLSETPHHTQIQYIKFTKKTISKSTTVKTTTLNAFTVSYLILIIYNRGNLKVIEFTV
jgi:hypothetical protein